MKIVLFLGFFLFSLSSVAYQKQLTHDQYDQVVNLIYDLYEPIVDQQGAVLVFDETWSGVIRNAYASRPKPYVWQVNLYGGLAREDLLTPDGYAYVICHELGHHLGGAPKDYYNDWASVEGQADYFASSRCLKRVFADVRSLHWATTEFTPEVINKCRQYVDSQQREICQRTIQAALSFTTMIASNYDEPTPDIILPDILIVEETLQDYPSLQCRLDTAVAGALCDADLSVMPDAYNAEKGFCSTGVGARPECWYNSAR